MKKITILLFTLFLVLFISGCTTTGGSLFQDIVSSASNEKPAEEEKKEENEENEESKEEIIEVETGLYIVTYPEGADIYINNEYAGESPLEIALEQSGSYKLTAIRQGYYENTQWVDFTKGTYETIEIDLILVTGFLNLSCSQGNAVIFLDSDIITTGITEKAIGVYPLTAELFGFEAWSGTVEIKEKQTVNLTIEMKKAEFELRDFSASRDLFSPSNQGDLGTTVLSFYVTNYGNGTITITNSSGEKIDTFIFSSFSNWYQKVKWDGRDNNNNPLPDGEYLVVLSGEERNSDVSDTAELLVKIDSTAVISYRSMINGVSGLFYCPTPETLPKWSYQLSTIITGHEETAGSLYPVQASVRFGVLSGLEAGLQGTILLQDPFMDAYIIGLSGKYNFTHKDSGIFKAGLSVKGTYTGQTYKDTQSNYTGITLGLPLLLKVGRVNIVMAPEITASPIKVSYADTDPAAGSYIWGYGRTGVMLDYGFMSTGISAVLRTKPFSEGFAIQFPIEAGWEFHILIPETQIYASFAVTGSYAPEGGTESADGYYLSIGGGLGVIN